MQIPEKFPIHPVAYLLPEKKPAEQARLVADIKLHGQLVPILRWRGQIIDGRHRLAACVEAGVEPWFQDLDDNENPGEVMLAMIALQRHLTASQLAAIAAELSQWSTPGRPRAEEANCVDLRIITALLNEWEVVLSWRHEAKTASLQSCSQETHHPQEIPVSDTQLA